MTEITRDHNFDELVPGVPGDSAAPGTRLREVREEGEALVARGAELINRLLSGDSRRFLEGSRQRGGQ